jgi:hypothetical protein
VTGALDEGRSPAGLVAVEGMEVSAEARLAQLEREGMVRRAELPPDAELLDGDAPRLSAAASLLGALLDERSESR